ncbi:hypothetical protein ACJIZ3_016319 [Penstemon smallii]|uniref:Uncharacterized protein n=1 Tax=Penstemon smallii TaxID=265156 RepID=A0ABD3RU28_9LAMI
MTQPLITKQATRVDKTGIDPIASGTEPDILFIDKSKSASRVRPASEPGIEPVSWFRPIRTRLNIFSCPMSDGISSNTMSWVSLPISDGISPEILFPERSTIRSCEREVMQGGISPEIEFQSVIMRVVQFLVPNNGVGRVIGPEDNVGYTEGVRVTIYSGPDAKIITRPRSSGNSIATNYIFKGRNCCVVGGINGSGEAKQKQNEYKMHFDDLSSL